MKKISALLQAAFLLSAALLSSQSLHAQQSQPGMISGRIVDASTGDPIIRATVAVVGTEYGNYTNVNGDYSIRNLPPGMYTIKVTYVGYATKTIENVEIRAGRTIRQDISLDASAIAKEVVITGKADQSRTNAALIEQKKASYVSDAISADQMSKASASDAGDAMKRVTGVSVVGSKYVIVRGLSERYSATQLNDINLPSPEPEKKVVPFDIFPAAMISRLTTVKTFTPDKPGDFAGGLVQINTKDFPESFLFNLSLGTGMNTEAQGADALTYPGGGTDFLGLDDGTRELPSGIEPRRRTNPQEQADLLGQFNNGTWLPETTSLPVNQSFNLSVGDLFDVGIPIGYLVSGSYANSNSFRVSQERYPLLELIDGRHSLRYDYTTRKAENSVLWGGLLNVSAQLAPEHKVSVKTVLNHTADDESRLVTGQYNQSTTGDIRYSRLRYVERQLLSSQLSGEHKLPSFLDSKIDWRAAISTADRYEPDNRATTYLDYTGNGTFVFANNFGSNNGRFFSRLDDVERNVGLDWTVPFTLIGDRQSRLKAGGLARMRDRDFSARRFIVTSFSSDESKIGIDPEELFTPANVLAGTIGFDEETQPTDRYEAGEEILAGYAMVDIPLTSTFRVILGARVEQWNLDLQVINPFTGEIDETLTAERNEMDILPSLNLVYTLGEEMNLRGSVTQTLARPEFRELAPFRFDDYRQSTYGNPELKRTQIVNLDLRWEWFPRPGELIAASGFYKSFTNPIEQFYLIGSGISVEPANAGNAVTYGAEFEFRKALDFISSSLSQFSLGSNLTLVQSEVTFEPDESVLLFDGITLTEYSPDALTNTSRPLQGQSPYVINATLGYENRDWGTTATLLYNVFGERLSFVGTNGIPDTYEQPRNAIDLTLTQKLPLGLQLKLAARNLLNEATVLTQEFTGAEAETIEVERYLQGRSLSLGLSFNLDQFHLQNLDDQE